MVLSIAGVAVHQMQALSQAWIVSNTICHKVSLRGKVLNCNMFLHVYSNDIME